MTPRLVRRRRQGTYFGPLFWMGVIIAASAVWVGVSTAPARAILLPALVMVDAAAVFFLVLYRRDRRLPVFEIGALWVFAVLLYAVYPLVNYYAAGLRWTMISDGRLYAFDPGPEETGRFAWLYAVCLIPFIVTYLIVRKRACVTDTSTAPVTRARVTAVVLSFIGCGLLLVAVARYFGISYDPSYEDVAAEKVATLTALPYVLQQVVHCVLSIRFLLVQIMLLMAMRHWRDWKYRAGVGLFFAFEIVRTVYVRGARTELTLLGITFVLLYHRLVRPLTLKIVLPAVTVLLMGFNFIGLLRAPEYLQMMRTYDLPGLAAINEFQVVWGTSYDIYRRQQLGILGDVEWQLPFSDFYYVIPSQLLPFEKIDVQSWYLQKTGYEGGLMFGVVSQALVGFGWKQLLLEGIFLGYIAAKLHRWYVKRAQRFWPLILYLFCCIWTYYSVRQTSLAVLSFIEYQFVPTLIMVELVRLLLQRVHTQARRLIRG